MSALVVVLLLGVAAAASVLLLFRWRAERRDASGPIPLVFPMNSGISWQESTGSEIARPMPGPSHSSDFETRPTPPTARAAIASFEPKMPAKAASKGAGGTNGVTAANGATGAAAANGAGSSAAPPRRERREPPVNLEVDEAALASNETVRFTRPGNDVVQLLPGRLEVLSGDPGHQEIRFVRVQGKPPQLILGRSPGTSPQHVSLRSSTVSRQHAKLVFAGGRWNVANLSETNPVVVNDEELANGDAARTLADGDRIELGEVVLRFRAH